MNEYSIEEARKLAEKAVTEQELSDILAYTWNKFLWVEDEEYDFEEGTPECIHARRVTDEWLRVFQTAENKIFKILESEGITIPEKGQFFVMGPFLERNGYEIIGGWVEKKEREDPY